MGEYSFHRASKISLIPEKDTLPRWVVWHSGIGESIFSCELFFCARMWYRSMGVLSEFILSARPGTRRMNGRDPAALRIDPHRIHPEGVGRLLPIVKTLLLGLGIFH